MAKKVRHAVINDVEKIMPLLSSVAQMHGDSRKDIFRNPILHYSASDIKNLIENGGLNVFVAVSEVGEVAGVLLCRVEEIQDHIVKLDTKVLRIEDTCVDERYRKSGYGKMLLDYAKEFAKNNGCSRMELNVWAFNRNAYDFYESQGMRAQRHTMEYIL